MMTLGWKCPTQAAPSCDIFNLGFSAFLWRYEPVWCTGKSDDWLTIFFARIIRFTVQKFQLFWVIFCIIIFFIELRHILILWLAKMPNGGMPVFTLIATGWRYRKIFFYKKHCRQAYCKLLFVFWTWTWTWEVESRDSTTWALWAYPQICYCGSQQTRGKTGTIRTWQTTQQAINPHHYRRSLEVISIRALVCHFVSALWQRFT